MDSVLRREARGTGSASPGQWWRQLGWATEQLGLCGDLAEGREGVDQLEAWVAQGVTHIMDVRVEWSDEELVAAVAPQLAYLYLGVDDHGLSQPDHWFAEGVAAGMAALAEPEAKLVVHCHMGVNRGPSMAYALLLAQGMGPIAAMEAIRAARPIAAAIYADDALDWHLRQLGRPDAERRAALEELEAWQAAHPVDTSWVISRIRQVGG